MHIIRDDWRLIVYYDTYPYKEETAAIARYISYLETICSTIKDQTPCNGIILQLGHEFEEIKHFDSIITMNESFVTGDEQRRRQVRVTRRETAMPTGEESAITAPPVEHPGKESGLSECCEVREKRQCS